MLVHARRRSVPPLGALLALLLTAPAAAGPDVRPDGADPDRVSEFAGTVTAASTTEPEGNTGDAEHAGSPESTRIEEVDGFMIGHLPPGIGDQVSDFSTEWGEVAFASRVWERRADDGSGHRVDLKVNVMRGERLSELDSLRAFLAEYHEVDPGQWDLDDFRHGDLPGHRTAGFVFWLVEPGVGVSVRLDPERFGDDELTRTALGVEPEG